MRVTKGVVSLFAAGFALALTPMGAAQAVESGKGAQTQHRATETFFDIVPCASDQGFFEISLLFNSVEKMSERGGHFTQTGSFTATPVTPTRFEVEEHDGHQHEHVVAAEPRAGATFTGRFTLAGTFRDNQRVAVETFVFRARGTSSTGERINAHGLFHVTTVDGEQKVLIERERCV